MLCGFEIEIGLDYGECGFGFDGFFGKRCEMGMLLLVLGLWREKRGNQTCTLDPMREV